jgi:hypothetical protein
MSTRVYVPTTFTGLRDLMTAAGIGPAPFEAHAVTDAVRRELPDASEEEWEHAAATAAARDSLELLADEDPPRRVVLAVDVETVLPAADGLSVVEVADVVPLAKVAAVLADDPAAGPLVEAARLALPAAATGDADAVAAVERCLDEELGWYAAQEIVDLLDS